MKTTDLLKTFLILALLMGLGTAWGQNTTQGPNDCIKVTYVQGSGTPTITYYQRLTTSGGVTGALNAVGGENTGAAANRKVFTIELLWPDDQVTDQYTLGNMNTFSTNYKDITIKTAEGSSFVATIKRGSYYAGQGMFEQNNANSTLTFENIILDGMNISSTSAGTVLRVGNSGGTVNINTGAILQNGNTTGNGGLVNVGAGTLNINEGAILQNGNTSGKGGLVNVSGGTLNIDGATLQNGQAANGAVISKAGTGALTITNAEIYGGSATSTLIDNTGSGTVTITGTSINGENATGALFNKAGSGALSITSTTINGQSATGTLINDTGTGTMTITDSEINGSTVANSGNLINKRANAATGGVNMTNTTFNGNSVTGDLITFSNTGTNRTMNVTFNNCTVNGATIGSGSLVSKATNGTFSATNGSVFNGNGSTGTLINMSNSTGDITFSNTTINGGTSTGNLFNDASTGDLSFSDCSINGSTVDAANTLITKSSTGAVTFANTMITRNQSQGNGFRSTSSGAASFTDCIIDGSENASATAPLIQSGSGNLTLTNTTVTGHTVSAPGVCAVDATSSKTYVSGDTSISENTSNGVDANLKVSGTNKLEIPDGLELSLTVGVTSTDNYASGQQFAVLGNGSSTGYQYFQNDNNNTLFGKKSGTANIVWGEYNLPTATSIFRIFDNNNYYYFDNLGSAIAKSNTMSANTTILALTSEYTALSTDAVAFTANHNVIIINDKEYAESFTLKRGAVAGNLLTFVNPGTKTLTLINTTLDGTASVTTTGSLIKMGGANILTLNNSSVINNVTSSSGVCGIDASGSTGKVNLVGNVIVKDNTANGAKANLSVTGTNRLTLTGNISGEVGVTTPQGIGTQFAYGNRSYTGYEALKNDTEENLRPYYYNNYNIYWHYCYMGLAYTFSENPLKATVSDYDLSYTGGVPMIVDQVPYNGNNVPVTDLTYFGSAATLRHKNLFFSEDMLNKMANNAVIGLPDIVAHLNDAIIAAVEGFTPGVNNADIQGSKNVWKKAEYNPETNQIEYTLKYLQLMTQDQPLDFVFSIDQTSTMCTADATANGVTAPRVMWMMALLQKTAYELISKNGDGYINKVAFIPWGNTTPTKSDFMSTDEEITNWFSGSDAYSHAAEGTNHAMAAQACVEMAHASLNANRIPIIIYMSDFQANAYTNRNNVNVVELRETTDYKTYAINIFADASANGNYYQNSGVYFADDPSEFMGVFSAIIKDAIGYYLNKPLVIEDGMSTPLAGSTPTAGLADGLLETAAGQASWTLGEQEPLLNAGNLYSSTFTVQLDDDAVYSGFLPTNSGLVVNSNGSEVNHIDGSAITLQSGVTLLLKSVNTFGTPIAGATFTLTHGSNTWNLTTDANGQIVLPWGENDVVGATTAESKFAFDVEQVYTLTQNTTLDGFVMPTGSWTLTVGSDYKITASGAMPAMEAHAGKLEIYNETVKIARVSNDNGATWTYHEYLINNSGTGSAQGAFDYANTLSGNVIIETLLETAVIGSENRYALTEGFTFNGTGLTGLTLKTTDDAGYNSTEFTTTISRGGNFGSLITFNKASTTMIIQNLTLDGNNGSYTCNTNGGLVNVTNGTLSLADGATLQNSTVDASHNGGGVYLGSGGNLTVSGVVVVNNNLKESVLNNVYLNDATNQYVTIGGMQELKRCSHIGITKTSGYTNDSNDALHTVIAQGGGSEPANYCNSAFYNGCFFDDLDIYKVYCLSYGSEYATNKLYFIDSWEGHVSAAVAGTDYVLNSDYVTEVKTATGLAYFAKDVNSGKDYSGKTVTLSSDIDLSGHYWVPIGQIYSNGCSSYSGSAFTGTFDGQGKRINNMMSILPCASLGLFGEVDGGNITNTFVESGNLVGTRKDGAYMGGLVGYLHDGSITYSEAAVTMGQTTRQYTMGGLVGSATNSTSSSILIHSSMAMPVMNEGSHMGGLVGILGDDHQGSIANCFVNAVMNKDSETYSVGGIVASHEEQAVFTNCYVRLQGNLPDPSTDRFGWLAGHPDGGTYSNCYIPEGKNQFGNGCSAESVTHCGTYGPTTLVGGKYGFRHRDLQMTVADITDLSEYNDTPEGGLTAILNSWVDEQAAANGYARWSRSMASPINGDYPILMLPDFESAASLTSTEFIAYGEVNNLIQYANANTSDGGNVYLYGDIDNDGVTLTQSTASNVRLFIHEDIGVVQDDDITVNARVGVTLKNDRTDESDPNWHTFASALDNAPTGIVYHTSEDADYNAYNQTSIADDNFNNTTYMDPPQTTWNTTSGSIGYFPTNTPYGAWRGTEDSNGFFDFYAYSEPYYHWINLKREGSNTIMDHWHIDTDASGNHIKINYKEEASNSNQLINGKGYLVALSAESMMMTDGQLNNGNVTMKLDKTDPGENTPVGKVGEDGSWRSFNLVGNPYQSYLNFDLLYEASANTGLIDDIFAIRDDKGKEYLFYTYEASTNPGYTATNLIHPHQGFFVRVNDDKGVGSYNLTFTNDMRMSGNLATNNPFRGSHPDYPLVNLLCFDSNGHRDLTTVEVGRPELGGGHKMFKLVNGDARLYARLEGGSYQTLFTPTGVNEVPVCFEAQNDGSFKLQWNTLHGDFYYLHLIDNLTGADIDMLSTDEYRFEGHPSDYASRFKLVFRCTGVEEQYDNNNTGSETFAFISDGNIIVLTDARSASLQVIDMLGRILLTRQVTSDFRLPTSDFSPGVYVLRLINGSDIKTQKLIINQ